MKKLKLKLKNLELTDQEMIRKKQLRSVFGGGYDDTCFFFCMIDGIQVPHSCGGHASFECDHYKGCLGGYQCPEQPLPFPT